MQEELIALLEGRKGHFEMESGLHAERWFELDRLLAQHERLQPFVSALALRLAPLEADFICGPETGGAELARQIAPQLGATPVSLERHAPAAAGELFSVRYRVPNSMRANVTGRRVVIVDDAISAGSAVRGTYADLIACGARPVALGALLVFGEAAERLARERDLALVAVARMPFPMWPPSECPLCRRGVALERVSDATPGG